jgi:ribosomal protein S18 acetylase RimI-like enzyme
VREVAWRSWAEAYGGFIPEADRSAFFDQHYREEGFRGGLGDQRALNLVAEVGGGIVGILSATHDPRGVHLWRLYVDPRAQRGGVGQTLWDALVGWASARGARRILFEVASQGVSAPRFYQKQGCRAVGELTLPVGQTPVRVARYVFRWLR